MEISDERLKEIADQPRHLSYTSEKALMAQELLERRKADRWIPVSERLPEMNIHKESKNRNGRIEFAFDTSSLVETFNPSGVEGDSSIQTRYQHQRRISYVKNEGNWVHGGVTHWRPLPAPPEVSNG